MKKLSAAQIEERTRPDVLLGDRDPVYVVEHYLREYAARVPGCALPDCLSCQRLAREKLEWSHALQRIKQSVDKLVDTAEELGAEINRRP